MLKYSLPVLVLAAIAGHARAQSYLTSLGGESQVGWGCHGPCRCLSFSEAATGSMRLTFTGSDGAYDHYAVTDVAINSASRAYTGTGEYLHRPAPNPANRLTLDLLIDGNAVHVDSSFTPEVERFPHLSIQVSDFTDPDLCYYNVLTVDARTACSADFDNDGDVATDRDIEAFFQAIAGDSCITCGSTDVNADGDPGTDGDIESFFRLLAGGAC